MSHERDYVSGLAGGIEHGAVAGHRAVELVGLPRPKLKEGQVFDQVRDPAPGQSFINPPDPEHERGSNWARRLSPDHRHAVDRGLVDLAVPAGHSADPSSGPTTRRQSENQ